MDRDWDIFCHVVDNFGDIGVCWRLACGLAGRGRRVRLFVDDARALAWMAPDGHPGVRVLPARFGGALPADPALPATPVYEAPDAVIAAFGCALPAPVLEALRRAGAAPAPRRIPWIHLEYLSAEPYAERSHGLASPVLGGAAAGVHRWFYFPGFTPATGGLLREPDLMVRRQAFDRRAWLTRQGIAWQGEPVISLFCYEPPGLAAWLADLGQQAATLLVAAGRGAEALRRAQAALGAGAHPPGQLRVVFLPPLAQEEFDHLLWASDLNFVRGEDSLVRALWAGAALVWQAYAQEDGAHRLKIEAFLDWLRAPASLRRYTLHWNGLAPDAAAPVPAAPRSTLALSKLLYAAAPAQARPLDGWAAAVQGARARLLHQDDLVTRLLRFVAETR